MAKKRLSILEISKIYKFPHLTTPRIYIEFENMYLVKAQSSMPKQKRKKSSRVGTTFSLDCARGLNPY